MPLVRLPIRTHDNRLRPEVVRQENYEALNGVHLMQTDNNVQPVMGAVHMVHPARNYSDKHFMLDIEGDINDRAVETRPVQDEPRPVHRDGPQRTHHLPEA